MYLLARKIFPDKFFLFLDEVKILYFENVNNLNISCTRRHDSCPFCVWRMFTVLN